MFSVDFYKEEDGSKPVSQFIRSLDVKMKAKVVSDLHRLEMLGNEARVRGHRSFGEAVLEIQTAPHEEKCAGVLLLSVLY